MHFDQRYHSYRTYSPPTKEELLIAKLKDDNARLLKALKDLITCTEATNVDVDALVTAACNGKAAIMQNLQTMQS